MFGEHLEQWHAYRGTPWARLRYDVVARTLARRTAGQHGLRVLDVGGGDAADSLPLALAGHDVTVLDPASGMLAAAREAADAAGVRLTTCEGSLDDPPTGAYDVVLCHFLLQYRADTTADVAALAAVTRPGGLLSLIAPHRTGAVLSTLVRKGPVAALATLTAPLGRTVTFDSEVRQIELADVAAALEAAGCRQEEILGLRVVNDLVTDDEAKHSPDFYDSLLRLELALHDREPYNRTGMAWHVLATRPST